MAHFAEIGMNNIVLRTVVISNGVLLDSDGVEQESLGAEFCRQTFGGTWVQTSYNKNFRVNFATEGMVYNSYADRFEPPKPYPSWTWNESLVIWEPPIAFPDSTDSENYTWDENNQTWVLEND